jgi:tetratricopeptide (TPR) repeat protein
MEKAQEAEDEFRTLTQIAPYDLLAATQLGFILYSRGEKAAAKPLFDRVLAGNDEDLANRVRAVLRMPQIIKKRIENVAAPSIDAKVMAERSIKAGYMKDALQYLTVAHETDPGDFDVMLKLGQTYNILHEDGLAVRWFDLARKSPDLKIAAEAQRSWRNLRASNARFRFSAWVFPVFSTRWNDLFSYAQVKTELRTGLPIRPYVSVRFVGDTRLTIGATSPQSLSESSFIIAVGAMAQPLRGVTAWFEAGSSISYVKGHMLPDYRGGVSAARRIGRARGWFADTTVDAVFVSRFDDDFLVYTQSRAGYTAGGESIRAQFYWNGNLTIDQKREYWANFVETGPGIRLSGDSLPKSMYLTFNLLRGAYLVNAGNPRRPNFNDFRAGFWYAFSH